MAPARRAASDDGRASSATVAMVFVGLAVVGALLAGGFYVAVTGGAEAGDPTEVGLSASQCSVGTRGDVTGIESATLTARYSGNGTVDLSDAELRYRDERVDAALSLAATASKESASVRNDSGAYDPTISAGEQLTVVVPVAAVRGEPLPSGQRATLELAFEQGTAASTSIRVPGGLGPDQSFVDC